MTSAPLSCTGALALELVPGSEAAHTALDAADAATLAGHIAHDLAKDFDMPASPNRVWEAIQAAK